MRRSSTLAAVGGIILLLTACAPGTSGPGDSAPGDPDPGTSSPETPAVDLDAARAWVEGVEESQSDGPGSAGSATLLVEPTTDGEVVNSVRIDFPAPTTLVLADASCFGGGAVEVIVTVSAADGSESAPFADEIRCDEEPHSIEIGGQPASAALIEARTTGSDSADATYAFVMLTQELTIER